ncbi:putative ribonuclease H protein [Vitis vinifera]|uniref:Putative ribonuclease H protein n=1 Tax=Vitis vinifera TaxID=29760 RepID=A0A438E469_VITVI|nr:putative ribonuclease H protein [Vitis vinifera]
MWLKLDGFKDLVRNWWNGYSVEGYSSHCIAEKLKALKKDLKNWNKEVAKENENPLTPGDVEAKNLALEDYKKWALLEETSWRQKSREIWLKEGDKNTKYFHKMANAKARRNFLSKIKVNGANLSSLEDIKEGVCRAYQSLLSDSGDWRPSINGLNFKELGEGLASSLEVMFSEEEIFAALSSFCGDKAPGPDGFTMAFWLFCWDVIKPEILGLFREFYLHGTFQRSLNSTFLLLIPKKEGTEDLRDFRPISLHAFVHGRQILDAVLIANEALDSRLKGNNPGLLLKMDIEKAFDHVKWDFLMDVMSKMGFGHRWIKWMNCPWPIAILCKKWGLYFWFQSGRKRKRGLLVSHLLFADDTLIFCDAEADQLQYLSWTFMWFEAISGLKVNLSKTEAIPVGEGIPMETLASVLGCKIGSLPTSYLGLPLGAPYKSTRVWDAVEERFRKRLSLWKRQYLSKGGRLTLLKSTLSSLPTYFLSLFVIPKKVCARLEKIQRDFLWGGGALENKPYLVSWKAICATKKEGGLGIRSLSTFNKALLGKWLWRLANENESLWKQIISSKYDLQEGGWCSKGVRDRYGVGVWKAIRNGWENFRSHSRFIIGDGTRVKFWKDLWCGNQALEEAFPILFNLSVNKEGWVAEAWEEDEVGGSWGLRFNRHLNDWEVGEVESLLCKLHPLTIRRGVEDLFRWKENKNGTFSVKSFYSSLSRDTKPPFPARTIWTPWVPIRASFFGWEAAWNRLLTIDRLKRFGWSIPNRCFLCKQEEETTDHLLLFCEKARMLWLLIFSLFGVQWVMHSSVKRNLLGWHGSFVGKKREKAWRAAPLCLMWTIWKERNRRAFNDIERNDQDIKSIFLYTFVNWVRVYIEEHTLSLIDFVDWLATK